MIQRPDQGIRMTRQFDSPEDMQRHRARTPIEVMRREVATRTHERLSRVRGDMSDIAFAEAVEAVTAMHLKDLERDER